MASAVARAYNGGLGAVPPAGPWASVIFVLTYFLVLVAVFEIFFSFSFVLVFIIFSF